MTDIYEKLNCFAEEKKEETLQLLEALTGIPAPTGKEEKRAAYILNWIKEQGIEGAFIDAAGNVVSPFIRNEEQEKQLLVVMAHMDTVFTETEPFLVEKDGNIWRAPGIGDDTANLVNMLMAMKFLHEHSKEFVQEYGILFVANVGEEGLGNLRGSREIYRVYQDVIKKWVSIDIYFHGMHNSAVGSHRYEIKVTTQGGHSFGDFGNANAIAQLSGIICKLYQQQVPTEVKTTYNVGMIQGGTSVNTIAQEAACLYEFRSESNECLMFMKNSFEEILKEAEKSGINAEVKVLGIRPGNGPVDPAEEEKLCDRIINSVNKYYPGKIAISSASTDCNIPLSHGIPSACFGAVMGAGLHTKEEWVDRDSMVTGQKIAIDVILSLC